MKLKKEIFKLKKSSNLFKKITCLKQSFTNGKKEETKYIDPNDRLIQSLNSMLSEPLKQSSTQESNLI
jgi:hypothetical protein